MTRAQPRRVRTVVGAAALAIVAAGCGGASAKTATPADPRVAPSVSVSDQSSADSTDAGSDESAEACQLLGESDVSAAMKQPMKVAGGAGGAICEWAATSDPSVLLAVQTFATPAEEATYTQLEPSSEHVDGVGDDAFWNPTLDMVFVQHGDRAFAVTSPSLANLTGDPQASESAMIGLAKIVLGHS